MSTSVRSLLRRGWLIRAAIASGLLAALLTVQNDLTALAPDPYHPFVRLALLVVAIGLGATAVREVVNAIFRTVDRQGAVVWRNLSSWTLYGLVGLMIASALNVNLSGLLVGGAIIGVIVATASQASLGNFFAGLVLMLVRPYQVGAAIRLRGPLSAGGPEFEGTVVDMGALYTTMRTATDEILKLPNSAVVSSALVMGEAPLQAEVEVELPPNTPLRPLEEAVKEHIGQPGTWVSVRPRTIRALDASTLICRVEVRSLTPIEPMVLAEALIQAVGQNGQNGRDGPVHAESSLAG